MAILNYKVKKITAEKTKADAKSIELSSSSVIVSAKLAKDKRIGDYLHVNFRYTAEYSPEVGKIEIEGSLWFQHPKLKTVVSEVKGKVDLQKDAMGEISNGIIQDSILEATDIARKLQLPPPLQLPTVTVKGDSYKFPKAE